jgi:ABC-2 type transport system permease protein
MRLSRIITVLKKEFIHIKRDKASLIMALIMPVMFIFMFGYAVNTDVDNVDMAILDMDKSTVSRELISKFEASNYFNITRYVKNIDEIEEMIKDNVVKSALVIPGNYSKNMEDSRSEIQIIIDGVDPNIASTALKNAMMVSNDYSISVMGVERNTGKIDVKTKVWYNPDLESTKFTIPGLIGLVMQNITVMLTAFSLVREKERGTMELLMVSPIKPPELILGKMIPYIIIGGIDFIIALVLGTRWFNVEIVGSVPLLLILGMAFVICSLAIGILISVVATNQAQAMQMTMLFILPSVLLSGFVFPREAMPFVIEKAGYFIPLTYFLEIIRGIILRGSSFTNLIDEAIPMITFMTFLIILASVKFRKKLD